MYDNYDNLIKQKQFCIAYIKFVTIKYKLPHAKL